VFLGVRSLWQTTLPGPGSVLPYHSTLRESENPETASWRRRSTRTAELGQRPVSGDLGATSVAGHVAGNVGQDFAPLRVDAQHVGSAVEAHPLKVAQEGY
jgi:hypothetical protein